MEPWCNGRLINVSLVSYHSFSHYDTCEYDVLIRKDLNNMVVSNAIGIPVIALLQGLVGFLGYVIIGVDEPAFWFVVTTITAMLPIVGAALAYVPLSLLLFANGNSAKGV